jgi:hypothetical protein
MSGFVQDDEGESDSSPDLQDRFDPAPIGRKADHAD